MSAGKEDRETLRHDEGETYVSKPDYRDTGRRIPIVFSEDLPACDCCGEPFCPTHGKHFADCPCLGPTSQELWDMHLVEAEGKLWAVPKD
jgi:hypothetical protein